MGYFLSKEVIISIYVPPPFPIPIWEIILYDISNINISLQILL